MKDINNLADLLFYQLQNLYAAEEQMQEAMPAIIEKVRHASLRNALQHHLKLTDEQKYRLQQAVELLREKTDVADNITTFASKGMSGLLEEMNETLSCNIADEVNDAVIIAYVQKLEHYEITTYGTAHAFAKQMNLHKVESLLMETLQEEYDADDLLTTLAIAALNKEAIPEDLKVTDQSAQENFTGGETAGRPEKVSISERTINSPGGRAGTSHRRYGRGESRGH